MHIDAFYDAARAVAAQASHIGLEVPAYRGRWEQAQHRMLVHLPNGSRAVMVDLSRSDDDVIDALVDGTLAANRRPLTDRVRADLDPRQEPLPFLT